jgi:hypothetical protein
MGQAGRGYPRVCPSPLGLTLVISHYHVDWHVAALLIERSQSCAIALRSPASERSSDLKRYSPGMRTTKLKSVIL